jgi:hypothetical protein
LIGARRDDDEVLADLFVRVRCIGFDVLRLEAGNGAPVRVEADEALPTLFGCYRARNLDADSTDQIDE